MKVLIIGSEGFIGSHCIRFFIEKHWEVHGCDLVDMKNAVYRYTRISRLTPDFKEVFVGADFDLCINAAGSGSVGQSIEHPRGDFEANAVDVFSILESIRLYCPRCKYINLSSAAVYGNPAHLPVAENHELRPLSPYGWHKYLSEIMCQEFCQLYGLSASSLRPFSVYGAGLKKQLFWDAFHKIKKGGEQQFFGTGKESRDFVCVADLIACIWLIYMHAPMKGESYNVGTGIETSVESALRMLASNFPTPVKITFNGQERPGDPKNWRADISRISNLGFKSSVTLEDGLGQYASWLKKNQA